MLNTVLCLSERKSNVLKADKKLMLSCHATITSMKMSFIKYIQLYTISICLSIYRMNSVHYPGYVDLLKIVKKKNTWCYSVHLSHSLWKHQKYNNFKCTWILIFFPVSDAQTKYCTVWCGNLDPETYNLIWNTITEWKLVMQVIKVGKLHNCVLAIILLFVLLSGISSVK